MTVVPLEVMLWLRFTPASELREWLTAAGTVAAAAVAAVAAYASWRSAQASDDTATATRELAEAEVRGRLDTLLTEVVSKAHSVHRLTEEVRSVWERAGRISIFPLGPIPADLAAHDTAAMDAGLEARRIQESAPSLSLTEVRAAIVHFDAQRLDLQRREAKVSRSREDANAQLEHGRANPSRTAGPPAGETPCGYKAATKAVMLWRSPLQRLRAMARRQIKVPVEPFMSRPGRSDEY